MRRGLGLGLVVQCRKQSGVSRRTGREGPRPQAAGTDGSYGRGAGAGG